MADQTLTVEEHSSRRASGRATVPALCRVLACDDLSLPPLWIPLLEGGCQITRGPAGLARIEEAGATQLVVSVDDGRASRPHLSVRPARGGLEVVDLGSKNGTYVDGAATKQAPLRDGARIEVGRTFFLYRENVDAAAAGALPFTLSSPHLPPLATASSAMASLFETVAQIAPSSVPVLILGETGTGKEVLARRVHARSARPGAFLAVNCGALPAELIESELFGARKGAYSGASADRRGLVRAADGGTLFLDEIGDLPLAAQATLLRVLQEKAVVPLGGTEPVPVDFRLVAATHRDLDAMVAARTFRADLRARLAGVTLTLPPLRERREDLGLLIAGFVAGAAKPVRLSVHAARALFAAPFAGNVRALQRAVEGALARAAPAADVVLLDEEHFPDLANATHAPGSGDAQHAGDDAPPDDLPLDDELGQRLVALMREHKGNISAAARALGKQRMQVYRWIERYGIDPDRYR